MKQGRALSEVLTELQRQNAAKQDFIGPAQAFTLRPDGSTFEIIHTNSGRQEVFGTTDLFHRQIGSTLGIPAKYYDQMRKLKPELLAENVNAWFADREQSYMIRSMDYGNGRMARALLSDRYRRIDNMEIASAVLPLFAGQADMQVMSCEVTENRMYLKIVNKRLETDVVPGDTVQGGVIISNSEVGLGAVSVQPLLYRLVCTNGMVVNDLGERRTHFDSIWSRLKEKEAKNIALSALHWIDRDFKEKFGNAGAPHTKKIKMLRNALEHKFVSVHMFSTENEVKIGKDYIYRISEDNLIECTMDLLQLIREAVIELTIAIRIEEKQRRRRSASTTTAARS